MSADNGVYILRTNGVKGGYEYRVAHAMAIENIDYDPEGTGIGDLYLASIFGKSKIYATKQEALLVASDIADSCDILEYGISSINKNIVFPNMTSDEANAKLKEMWNGWAARKTAMQVVTARTLH